MHLLASHAPRGHLTHSIRSFLPPSHSLTAIAGAGAAGGLLGYLYLDLHPREGKYNHAAVFPIVSGCDAGTPRPDGSAGAEGKGERVLPVCAMVCNFPKAMGDKPALLPHGDAVTLGHELGHVLHHLLSRTKTKRFSSFAVEGDYVEAPSVSSLRLGMTLCQLL